MFASQSFLVRTAGIAALGGAALRLMSALPDLPLSLTGREGLYLLIDLQLILTLFGLLATEPRARTATGLSGLAIAFVGFGLIRTGSRVGPLGSYASGAAVVAIGCALLGSSLIRGEGLARAIGAAWLASFTVGLVGQVLQAPAGFIAASVLSCAGFAFSGWRLLVAGARRISTAPSVSHSA